MFHIAIEGIDGVGKTTLCKIISERLGYKFIEKPLHYLFDNNENEFERYNSIRDKVNKNNDRLFTSLFYLLGTVYTTSLFRNEKIVTDRFFASVYAWSGTEENKDLYELIINKIGKPNLTIILNVEENELKKRLISRNKRDNDINKVNLSQTIYSKMQSFCKEMNMNFMVIDTTNKEIEKVANEAIYWIKKNEEY